MEKIKQSSAMGTFYFEDKKELLSQLKTIFSHEKVYDVESRAIIVPHAGYVFSGALAAKGYQCLKKTIKNIFIISPVHYVPIDEVTLCSYDFFKTPLGTIPVNKDIVADIVKHFGAQVSDIPFEKEHAIEVQIPFIQYLYEDVRIIPVLASGNQVEKISNIIKKYYKDEENAFVISTDLSHFHTDVEAKKIDKITAEMIEQQDLSGFQSEQACGSTGLCAAVDFAKANQYSFIRIGLTNSAAVTADKDRVVGYGAWMLQEMTKSEFIKEYFSPFAISVCYKSIAMGLNNKKLDAQVELKVIPPVFDELGASFVTLKTDGSLRGCIGSIIAHRPLIADLINNASAAAFQDPRFAPLTEDEFDNLDISISLLSAPMKIEFSGEQDLLQKIKPFEDGIIIKDGAHQAVYLPSVWEQLPEKVMFLNSLKQKAGLRPDYFSKTFEAYRFSAIHIDG
ncbi:MAG: AmmeMemoRadiSam system protein B [Candidatus Gastranaerophilales bacterium]|nr:AmmeMemoRadiSam system protein B [Candidatus Gastranaerophilales bacterium]